jgi:hypothetical protein
MCGPGHGLLRRRRTGRSPVRRDGAAVELLDLRVRQVADQLADPAAALALERTRSRRSWLDHDDTVLRNAGVELERGHADLECLAEGGQRVLGAQPRVPR